MQGIPKISGLRLLRYVTPLLKQPLETLQNITNKFGNVVEFNAGKYQQLYFVSDERFVKHILKTNKQNYRRSPVIKALSPLLGNGIFISEDEKWKSQQQTIKPGFHEKIIAEFAQLVNQKTEELIQTWNKEHGLFNIETSIERCMLDILVQSQFCSGLQLDLDKIIQAHKQILDSTNIKNQKLHFFANRARKAVGIRTKAMQVLGITYLNKVAEDIIAYSKNHPEQCGYWMKTMIENNQPDEDIKDMVLNFLFAGYDTTASALSWSLFLLAKHPEIQKKVRKNSEENSDVYIKQVVQECLRLYPPVWSIHRQSVEDDVIEGISFPANSYFMICSHTLHRDPIIWSNPNSFNPERFTPDLLKGKAFQYIPFGQGERLCTGKPLALMQLHQMITQIVKSVDLYYEGKSDPVVDPGIIIKSKNGISLEVKPRKN